MNLRRKLFHCTVHTKRLVDKVWTVVSSRQIFHKMWYVAFTRFFGFFITKTIVNHRTWIWEKPLKNHRCQWSICKKTFNGDGQGVAKPLKNHRWQWCPEEKTLPSHRLKKMTIVEVYVGQYSFYKRAYEVYFKILYLTKNNWGSFNILSLSPVPVVSVLPVNSWFKNTFKDSPREYS